MRKESFFTRSDQRRGQCGRALRASECKRGGEEWEAGNQISAYFNSNEESDRKSPFALVWTTAQSKNESDSRLIFIG